MTFFGGGFAPSVPRNGMPMGGGQLNPFGMMAADATTQAGPGGPTGQGVMGTGSPAGSGMNLRHNAAAAVTRAYRWLEQALPEAPDAAMLVPELVTAVSLYSAQQYEACLRRTAGAYEVIAAMRARQPGLPPLPS